MTNPDSKNGPDSLVLFRDDVRPWMVDKEQHGQWIWHPGTAAIFQASLKTARGHKRRKGLAQNTGFQKGAKTEN